MPVTPLVSILIPAYNAAKWIAETLRSAVAQTWENKEVIVIDDGSTDDTLAIVRRFAADYDCLRVFTQKNAGAAATRNAAFNLSRGDYIQWLDADDLLGPDKIALQMEVAQRSANKRILLSGAWGSFMYRHYRAEFVPTSLWHDLDKTEWLLRKMSQNLHMQTATWLVSRELTDAAGPWNTKLLGDDDGEYFCRVLLASEGIRFIANAKVYYRTSGASSLSYVGRSNRKLEAQWRSMKLHVEYLRSLDDSERIRKGCVQYLQRWSELFYPERLDLIDEIQKLAEELGGQIAFPRFSWKYAWIEEMFGRNNAKRVQVYLRQVKWSMVRSWDKALSRLQQNEFSK